MVLIICNQSYSITLQHYLLTAWHRYHTIDDQQTTFRKYFIEHSDWKRTLDVGWCQIMIIARGSAVHPRRIDKTSELIGAILILLSI